MVGTKIPPHYPYYVFKEDDCKVSYEARYYNCNYHACAIVAVVTKGVDWAAYMNGCDASLPEEEALKWVATKGAKLSERDARYYFSEIKLPYSG